jgi:hypothetical protein
MQKKKKYPKEIKWLKNKADLLMITKIEREIGVPFTTIKQFVDGNRELPDKWIPIIKNWIKEFKKDKPP